MQNPPELYVEPVVSGDLFIQRTLRGGRSLLYMIRDTLICILYCCALHLSTILLYINMYILLFAGG